MADHDNLRYTLDLARTSIHEGHANQALEHLRCIRHEIEDLQGSSFLAEYTLLCADALAAMNDHSAEATFQEALKQIGSLSESDLGLEMRVRGDLAKYLAGRRRVRDARAHYQKAEHIAERLDRPECVAHFQMCVIRIELEQTNSSMLPAFQRLQEAAKDGYTELQQRDAWIHYVADIEEMGSQLVAARKGDEASVGFFRGLLSKIRRDQK